MEHVVADTLWQQRFNLQLIELFAGQALTLAAVGLKECCHIPSLNARAKYGYGWRWAPSVAMWFRW